MKMIKNIPNMEAESCRKSEHGERESQKILEFS